MTTIERQWSQGSTFVPAISGAEDRLPIFSVKGFKASLEKLEKPPEFDPAKYGSGGGPFDFSRQASLLHASLLCAVPLWIHELRPIFENDPDEIQRRASRCAQVLAEHGDALMFRVKDKSAIAFNSLACGLACASFCPGGITFLGSKWEAKLG